MLEWDLIIKIDNYISSGSLCQHLLPSPLSPVPPYSRLVVGEPPPQFTFKLKFDGSVRSNSATTCFMIRDSYGQYLHKDLAILEKLKYIWVKPQPFTTTSSLPFKKTFNISISKLITSLSSMQLKVFGKAPWYIAHIIKDIQTLLLAFDT